MKDVWIKRKQLIPQKPLFLEQKTGLLEQNETETGVNENQNPQSKVNKSKVNNTPLIPPKKINFENNRFTDIPVALMEKWREVAPGINISDEIKKAELWLLANPQKRRSRYNSFLSTWMVRAQDHFIKYGGNGNSQKTREQPPLIVSCPSCGGRVTRSDLTENGCVNCRDGVAL